MDPGGQKSIFGQKLKISIFRPKIDPGGQKSILVKKSKFKFLDQNKPKNGDWRSQIDFWSKNENFDFLAKN